MSQQKNLMIFAFLFLLSVSILFSQENTYVIEGKIHFKVKGKIYVILVNEYIFNKEASGIKKLILSPSSTEEETGIISFSFTNIKPGTYGIKCFLDKNNNGKLDKGYFGPTEPWGMSWRDKKPFGRPPNFEEIAFEVTSNINNLIIELN